jgi:hypothetical protein
MNKILMALTILGTGAGCFLTSRQATTQSQHALNLTREAWHTEAQLLAAAESERAGLTEHIRDLKHALRQPQTTVQNAHWPALQTNSVGSSTELREHLLEELGFNWRSSGDFIVVSKDTVRELTMFAGVEEEKLIEAAAAAFAMTPEEREQVEAALQRVRTDFSDWVLPHIERNEPKDDVVAQYTLHRDSTMLPSITNNFATAVTGALGKQRGELILDSVRQWMFNMGIFDEGPETLIVRRYSVGNEQRLKVRYKFSGHSGPDIFDRSRFPRGFLPLFPNGWEDLAQREGFALPQLDTNWY